MFKTSVDILAIILAKIIAGEEREGPGARWERPGSVRESQGASGSLPKPRYCPERSVCPFFRDIYCVFAVASDSVKTGSESR